jgi:hypothetical protein
MPKCIAGSTCWVAQCSLFAMHKMCWVFNSPLQPFALLPGRALMAAAPVASPSTRQLAHNPNRPLLAAALNDALLPNQQKQSSQNAVSRQMPQHCCRLLPFGSQARSRPNAQATTRRLHTYDTDRRDPRATVCARLLQRKFETLPW